MNDKALRYYGDARRDASEFDKLIDEFKSIKRDMTTIADMELSEEAKKLCLNDLEKQIANVKERMHNAVDEM